MGFDRDPAALEAAIRFVEDNPARFVFLAVGSPRQEIVAETLVRRGKATGVGLCIGASLLFLTGAERRAPRALQSAGMEWAWRLLRDPRRLARRYLVDGPQILHLLWREARRGA
jgi:exopolysaccharide biosynthesis WecB/TagA/CpsF family protein